MGEDIRHNNPSLSPDLEATGGCGCELTRTNSDSSSITADNSKEAPPRCGNAGPLGQLAEWTDEKHSLYLDSLEASFITELQRSMNLRACCSQDKTWRTYSSEQPQANILNSSDPLVVPRDGCWQKINFERDDPVLDSTADSHAVLGSPCIGDFTSSGKRRYESSADFQEHGVLCQERTHLKEENISYGSSRRLGLHSVFHLSQQDLVGSTMEVSDQNFAYEDQREKSSCRSKMKRLKTTAADASGNDQVVPFGKFHTIHSSTVNNASSEGEQQGHFGQPSEHPENLVCPIPGLHSFLKAG
ncbi:hypothetical protein CJ030_MR7G007475 [Morella rubra]|uniref:Uncharacterized protein n=1 Tax=Morella rubra TaxID=262757 RepID=A0A6A1V6R1_9ROSI|nr:hypothetical protein CJ030_MR7G007475 [Morella rubra]